MLLGAYDMSPPASTYSVYGYIPGSRLALVNSKICAW